MTDKFKTKNATTTCPIRLIHIVRDFSHGGMENGVANLINHHDPERVQGTIYVLAQADGFVHRVHDQRRVEVFNRCQGNDPWWCGSWHANCAKPSRISCTHPAGVRWSKVG